MASDIKLKTYPLDLADHIKEPDAQAELLQDAFASGHAGYMTNALGIVARARGMTEVARASGVTREALYRALSPKGDPKLSTLLPVLRTLGFRMALSVDDEEIPRSDEIISDAEQSTYPNPDAERA